MTKIEKYFVIVCEEDYPIDVWDWDNLTNAERVQCVDDARNPDVDFIYNQEWIIQDDDSSLYASLNELVGRSCKITSKVLIHEDPITRESIDAMWANLRKRIQKSDEPIKVTGIIGNLNRDEQEIEIHLDDKVISSYDEMTDEEHERRRHENAEESKALGDA